MRALPAYRTCAIVLLVMSGALACSAQYQQANTATAVNDGMTLQGVKTGLYVISSEGSNSVLRLSGNGLILVDGQPSSNYDALRARAKRISD